MAKDTKLSIDNTLSACLKPKIKKKLVSPNIISKSFPIVGIGSSAGGLEALEKFFIHMPH